MALRRNVLRQDDILCELYADTRSDVSVYSDNESMDSDSDIPTASSRKQLWSSTGPLTPQFPHPFFLTSINKIFITVWNQLRHCKTETGEYGALWELTGAFRVT